MDRPVSKVSRPCAPVAVRDALGGEGCPRCENPSLLLGKFARVGGNDKAGALRAVAACHAKHAKPVTPVEPKGAVCVWARLRSRLLVNLAGGVLENAGLALHPHFGVPYLPGSAVKGIARHAAWCEWEGAGRDAAVARRLAAVFGFPTGDKKKGGLDEQLRALGEPEHAGCVAFLPAYPEAGVGRLEVEVATCHHAKYYQKEPRVKSKEPRVKAADDESPNSKEPRVKAADDESPKPVFFPAVAAGVTFRFTLVPLRGCTPERMEDARRWLLRALIINGAGAKTAAGYGWFEDVTAETQADLDRQRAEAERRKAMARLEKALADFTPPENDADVPAAIEETKRLRTEADALRADPALIQRFTDRLNTLRKRLPQESPVEVLRRRWAREKDIVKDAKRFPTANAEMREAMVALFLEPGTLPHRVYDKIQGGLRGFPGDAQKAIRAAVKAREGGRA